MRCHEIMTFSCLDMIFDSKIVSGTDFSVLGPNFRSRGPIFGSGTRFLGPGTQFWGPGPRFWGPGTRFWGPGPHFGVILTPFWGHFDPILDPFWDPEKWDLGTFDPYFRVPGPDILTPQT